MQVNSANLFVNFDMEVSELRPRIEMRSQRFVEVAHERVHGFLNGKQPQKSCVIFAQHLQQRAWQCNKKTQLTQRGTRDSDACVKGLVRTKSKLTTMFHKLDGGWRLEPYPMHGFQYRAPRPMHEFHHWLKSQIFFYSLSFSALVQSDPFKFMEKLYGSWNESSGQPTVKIWWF